MRQPRAVVCSSAAVAAVLQQLLLLLLLLMFSCERFQTGAAAAATNPATAASGSGSRGSPLQALSSSSSRVHLSANVTGSKVQLTCRVSDGSQKPTGSIKFNCPANKDYCFQNCLPYCVMTSGECKVTNPALSNISCGKQSQDFAKQITLQFDISDVRFSGEWSCVFTGVSSCPISLNHMPAVNHAATVDAAAATAAVTTAAVTTAAVTTAAVNHSAVTATRAAPVSATVIPDGELSNIKSTEIGDCLRGAGSDAESRWQKYARADYVISLLAVLAASLIINVAFCIRCILARIYISMRRRKQQPPGCLAHCLCVGTVQVVEKDDTYEEVGPKLPQRGTRQYQQHPHHQQQRGSTRTMETTYIEHSGCIPRSRTMPPPRHAQHSLYYLQGMSDSMSRILYDDVPVMESRPSSRHGSRPQSPSFQQQHQQQLHLQQLQQQQLLSGRHSRSRGSLRGLHKLSGGTLSQANVPAVPEEAVPFISDAAAIEQQQQQQQLALLNGQQQQQQEQQQQQQGDDDDDDAKSDYSGTTRLELSRMMLRKADTLLREANSLLRESANNPEQEALDASD